MRFVVDDVTLKDVSELFLYPLIITIQQLLRAHLPPSHEVCDSPDHAELHRTDGPISGNPSVTQNLVGLGVKVVQF
jgi:hypothetical protein